MRATDLLKNGCVTSARIELADALCYVASLRNIDSSNACFEQNKIVESVRKNKASFIARQ